MASAVSSEWLRPRVLYNQFLKKNPAPRTGPLFDPQVELRFQRVENRLAILEAEGRSTGVDLSQFYVKPTEDFPAE